MNKVICDVCGTKYPETTEQCPICGCAKPENARIVSDEVSGTEAKTTGSYTYVKGGRFSKGNVRKRNKASVVAREEQKENLNESEKQSDKNSNKGLVIAIIALLLAIVAVMLFIFFKYFAPAGSKDENTVPVQTSTVETTTVPVVIPCTGLELSSSMVSLENLGDSWLLNFQVMPADTTDEVSFTTSDAFVATVNSEGRITAVSAGEAIITVTCGEQSVACTVTVTDPAAATETTVPETTEVTEPVSDDWKMNRSDISFTKAGDSWNLFKGSIPADVVTWTSDDETVATIINGVVTAVGPGNTNVHGELNGTKYSCIIRCRFTAASQDSENDSSTETTTATQTSGKYVLCIDGVDVSKRPFGNDVSIKVGEKFQLTLRTENGDIISVNWSASKDGICSISGNTITGTKKGQTNILVNYAGYTYTCIVNVK